MTDRPESDVVAYSSPQPHGQHKAIKSWVKWIILVFVCLPVIVTLVGAILSLLFFPGRTDENMHEKSTMAQINVVVYALNMFKEDNGRYPTPAEGLDALVHSPAGLTNWRQSMVEVPLDSWGNNFRYSCPGKKNPGSFDVISAGPDGKFGTADDIEN